MHLGGELQALYLQQGPAPLVSLRLVIPAGAATDPAGSDGLTTLMADVLDEGAGKRSALELEAELQALATDYRVAVTTDDIVFKLDGLADTFEAALALLADIVQRPRFEAREFQRKKEDLIAAALARKANPRHAGFAVLRRALFARGYAGPLVTGTTTSLARLSLAQAKRHYQALVQPRGATFVVTGSIEAAAVERALSKEFGDWSRAVRAAPRAHVRTLEEPGPKSAIHFVDFPGSSQSFVALAQRAEEQGTSVLFPAMIANRVLGGAFTSRLNLNLREQKGYTYGVHADFARFRAAGMHVAQASVKADVTRAALEEMLRELKDICGSRPITESEHEDAVNGLILGFPGQFEQNDVVSDALVELVADGRKDDWYELWPSRVRAVTLPETRLAIERYCEPARYLLVVAGDKKTVLPDLRAINLPIVEHDAEGEAL